MIHVLNWAPNLQYNVQYAFQVKGTEMQEEILGRGFIEDKLCELGLGEVGNYDLGNQKKYIFIAQIMIKKRVD